MQWSIISGPGTINSTGLYTGPSTQPSAGSAVVIQAKSVSTPAIAATAIIYFAGSTYDFK